MGRVKQFSAAYSQGQIKVRSKRPNFQFHVNNKGIYKMQFEVRNSMVPFVLLSDVLSMLKYAFEL